MATLYEAMNDNFDLLPVKIYKHDLNGKHIWTPLHWHRSIEILVTLEGRHYFNVESCDFLFTEDDWLFVNSSELHSSRYININDHLRGISIIISLPFIETWLGKGLFFYNPHNAEVTKQVKQIASYIYDSDTSSPYYGITLMQKTYELLMIIGNHCIQKDKVYSIPLYKEQGKASEFLEYIEQNYKEELSLKQIAAHFKYSPSYFSRFFKEIVGVGYNSYLNFVRVNHAADQLLKTHSTLTICALNNGFPNTKSFITSFKKLYGCTPGKFINS
jgi:AraC-like DNA-binding protein